MTPLQLPFYAEIEPESLLILASFLWGGAALATALPAGRFPSEFPLTFAIIGIIAALVGITEYVPELADMTITFIGVSLFVITPLYLVPKLYRAYPPKNDDSGGAAKS